ncbi:MAG: dihydroorotase [archaeon]
MIDPHVHLRDWDQKNKETVLHGLNVAYKAGCDAIFEMPNTSPALTTRKTIEDRIKLGDKAIGKLDKKIFHGIYAGITSDPEQIKEVVEAYNEHFPRVVGLKMFSGHSTGNMGLVSEREQGLVYHTLAELGYEGVLVNHCEKEGLIRQNLWDPNNPITHTIARPPEAEVQSVRDQIRLADAKNYKGTLHIAHLSVPDSYLEIEKARQHVNFRISCEVAPHHAMLYDKLMNNEQGLLLKMNPPLRPREMQEKILSLLLEGEIDYIGTDHAPHTLGEKMGENAASGIPGLPNFPAFVNALAEKGLSENEIDKYTHDNIIDIFNMPEGTIPNTHRGLKLSKNKLDELSKEYDFNPFKTDSQSPNS